MTLLTIALVLFAILACAAIAFAVIVGGPMERRAAWGCLIAIVATQFASLLGPYWRGPEYGVMVVDAIFAAWLTHIACRSRRWWSIVAAAAQLDGTVMHVSPIALRDVPDTVYLWVQPAWAVVVLAAIAYGAAEHRRETRRDARAGLPH